MVIQGIGGLLDNSGTINASAGNAGVFLTHGGTFFPNGAVVSGPLAGQQGNNPLTVPSYGLNCNVAFVSSMNYLFQVRGFPDGGIDYSGQILPNLSRYSPIGIGGSAAIGSGVTKSEAREGCTRKVSTIAVGCALGYLDFRFADHNWRAKRPKLAKWFTTFSKLPSMKTTAPPAA